MKIKERVLSYDEVMALPREDRGIVAKTRLATEELYKMQT